MRKMIVYQCETCKKESSNAREIYACEAAHLGLTVEEMDAWQQLLKEETNACMETAYTKNEKTEYAASKAIKACLEFEKEHGLR